MVSEFIMAVKVIFEIICWKNFLNLIFFLILNALNVTEGFAFPDPSLQLTLGAH